MAQASFSVFAGLPAKTAATACTLRSQPREAGIRQEIQFRTDCKAVSRCITPVPWGISRWGNEYR